MTPQQFRKIVLSIPRMVEQEHMGHPDFRLDGKVVASLGAPNAEWGMLRLTAPLQNEFCDSHAEVFQPCSGAWGRSGCTNVRLSVAKTAVVRNALEMAIKEFCGSGDPKKAKTSEIKKGKEKEKTVVRRNSKTPIASDSDAVEKLLSNVNHSNIKLIEWMRAAILQSNPTVLEGIKWNSPSFYCSGWFATFHLRSKTEVVLVLHHGAKVREGGGIREAISDLEELLEWKSADRAIISVADATAFGRKQQAAFKAIIKQWVQFQKGGS